MSYFKRTIIITALNISMFVPLISLAQSDNSALIAQLLAQIKALQLQLQALQNQQQSTQWCHTFNKNLGIGTKGDEQNALEIALSHEGFSVEHSSNFEATFDERIASAVTGFQEKYKDEILTPNGLQYGTGFVGVSTRKKLNSLYGCEKQPKNAGNEDAEFFAKKSTISAVVPVVISSISPSFINTMDQRFSIVGSGFTPTNNTLRLVFQTMGIQQHYLATNLQSQDQSINITKLGNNFCFTVDDKNCQQDIWPGVGGKNGGPSYFTNRTDLPLGTYNVSVANSNGTSNAVLLTVHSITSTADWSESAYQQEPNLYWLFKFPVHPPQNANYQYPNVWAPTKQAEPVTVGDPALSCVSSLAQGPGVPSYEPFTINGNNFCLVTLSEAAMGSRYTTVTAITKVGNSKISIGFTYRFVNCDSYTDSVKATQCRNYTSIDLKNLMQQILSTFQVKQGVFMP